jgi:hypothetical protein
VSKPPRRGRVENVETLSDDELRTIAVESRQAAELRARKRRQEAWERYYLQVAEHAEAELEARARRGR